VGSLALLPVNGEKVPEGRIGGPHRHMNHDATSRSAGRNFASSEIIVSFKRPSKAAAIVSSTECQFASTSACQTRKIDHPFLFILSSLKRSVRCSACWLPSTSTTRFRSLQAKSAKNGPIGSCLTNLYPFKRLARRSLHKRSSASLPILRSCLARLVLRTLAPRIASPSSALRAPFPRERGEGKDHQALHKPRALRDSISAMARSRSLASRISFSTPASSDLSA